jgi:hypothetical protein
VYEASRIDRALTRVVVFKNIILGLGTLLILGLAVYSLIKGQWIAALILAFVVEPIWFVVADIVTGLLAAPFVGVAAARDRHKRAD